MNRRSDSRHAAGLIAVLLGLMLTAGASFAQSGLEAGRDLQNGQTNFDGPESSASDLSKHGIDRTKQTPNPTGQMAVVPYYAEAGPLTLLNCSRGTIVVNTFNSNDGVLLIPYQARSIAGGAKGGLACATKSCKLRIGTHTTAAVSGYRVYIGGSVKATNKAAMDRGCSVY